MPILSVIVPIYRVEAYLPACIDSILDQTISDLEVILIDDGSPDKCGNICDEYAAKDGRVKVIHQSNHGVSFARNKGLSIAAGEYVGFVDPDDLVCPEMYQAMIKAAKDNDADIAVCGFSYCSDNGCEVKNEPIPSGLFSQRELIMSIYGTPNPFHGSMCNKIFSKRLLKDMYFDESVAVGEDWLLLYECYERADKAIALDKCYYTIRIRPDSATRNHTAQLYLKKLEAYETLFLKANDKDREIQKMATNKILDTYLLNKEAVIRDDYDRKSITRINRKMIGAAIRSFIRGNLPIKRMLYYVMRGFSAK